MALDAPTPIAPYDAPVKDLYAVGEMPPLGHVPVIVGGIIPDDDAARLTAMGVARVYTPKDFQLNTIMMDIVGLVAPGAAAA